MIRRVVKKEVKNIRGEKQKELMKIISLAKHKMYNKYNLDKDEFGSVFDVAIYDYLYVKNHIFDDIDLLKKNIDEFLFEVLISYLLEDMSFMEEMDEDDLEDEDDEEDEDWDDDLEDEDDEEDEDWDDDLEDEEEGENKEGGFNKAEADKKALKTYLKSMGLELIPFEEFISDAKNNIKNNGYVDFKEAFIEFLNQYSDEDLCVKKGGKESNIIISEFFKLYSEPFYPLKGSNGLFINTVEILRLF